MKNDTILSALISFLVPIILLYGLFFLADFFESGFFAFIYSMVLFVSAFMIFSVSAPSVKILNPVQIEFVYFFVLLVFLAYIISILLVITNFFAL